MRTVPQLVPRRAAAAQCVSLRSPTGAVLSV
jgi:hypothetical protein